MNVTTTTTMSPSDDAFASAATSTTSNDDTTDFDISDSKLFMVLWIFSMIMFLCLPFCVSSRRRKLCWRRIQERRWIHDDGDDYDDDWYYSREMRRQQEQRRQHLEEQQRQFRTTRTQQDEIREQYLQQLMEPYTMTLSEDDIHEMEQSSKGMLLRSNSSGSLGSRGSCGGGTTSSRKNNKKNNTTVLSAPTFRIGSKTIGDQAEKACEPSTAEGIDVNMETELVDSNADIDIDLESQPVSTTLNHPNPTKSRSQKIVESNGANNAEKSQTEIDGTSSTLPRVKEIRSDTASTECTTQCYNENGSSQEDPDNVVMIDFAESNRKVYVPLPGQQKVDEEQQQQQQTNGCTTRRLAPGGCTVCLCLFEPNERVTWSSNTKCSHLFHSDCVLHWYLAVGRKEQKRRLRQNPNMTDEDVLANICKFPTLCPTCRQPFCVETNDKEPNDDSASSDNDDESNDDADRRISDETNPELMVDNPSVPPNESA